VKRLFPILVVVGAFFLISLNGGILPHPQERLSGDPHSDCPAVHSFQCPCPSLQDLTTSGGTTTENHNYDNTQQYNYDHTCSGLTEAQKVEHKAHNHCLNE